MLLFILRFGYVYNVHILYKRLPSLRPFSAINTIAIRSRDEEYVIMFARGIISEFRMAQTYTIHIIYVPCAADIISSYNSRRISINFESRDYRFIDSHTRWMDLPFYFTLSLVDYIFQFFHFPTLFRHSILLFMFWWSFPLPPNILQLTFYFTRLFFCPVHLVVRFSSNFIIVFRFFFNSRFRIHFVSIWIQCNLICGCACRLFCALYFSLI